MDVTLPWTAQKGKTRLQDDRMDEAGSRRMIQSGLPLEEMLCFLLFPCMSVEEELKSLKKLPSPSWLAPASNTRPSPSLLSAPDFDFPTFFHCPCFPVNVAEMESSSDAVALLVREAHDLSSSTRFASFIASNHDSLSYLINRHLHLVSRRSTNLQDGQVTVYDKALLQLTGDGYDLTSDPAIHLFCKEYLGIDEENIEDSKLVLEQHSILPSSMDKASTLAGSQRGSQVNPESDTPTALILETGDMDPAYTRLMAVYEQARTDFVAVADNDDHTTIDAAKFVRDTVENVIDNLKGKSIEADKYAELRTMARMAKDTVEKLCGGKKRKFDRDVQNQKHSLGPSTGTSDRSRLHSRNKYPHDRHVWLEDEGRKGRERSPLRRQGYKRRRSPERVRIPYGYTRPVDTYYPTYQATWISGR